MTRGLVTMPRGLGAMAAMFLVAPLITLVDNRLIIGFGFLLTATLRENNPFSVNYERFRSSKHFCTKTHSRGEPNRALSPKRRG
jgi:hypothetical protein